MDEAKSVRALPVLIEALGEGDLQPLEEAALGIADTDPAPEGRPNGVTMLDRAV